MAGRQEIEAAFSTDGAPRIPAVVCYEGIFVRDHWAELCPAEPWWYLVSPDLTHQLKWRRRVIEAVGQDWFVLPLCEPRESRGNVVVEEEADGAVWRSDRITGRRQELQRPRVGGWSPSDNSASVRVDDPPLTREAVDVALGPAAVAGPTRAGSDGRGDLAAALLAQAGARHFPLAHVASPLWQTYQLWGFEGMMTMVAERPDLVRHACDRLARQAEQRVRNLAAIGAAGIWIEECMTDMISPEHFRLLNVPVLRRLAAAIRKAGMRSIYYYCGNPVGKLDLLLGNLDAIGVLQNGTEADLRAEIARQVAAGRRNGNRFIMSIGSPVTPGTPVGRVRRYREIVHEIGR